MSRGGDCDAFIVENLLVVSCREDHCVAFAGQNMKDNEDSRDGQADRQDTTRRPEAVNQSE